MSAQPVLVQIIKIIVHVLNNEIILTGETASAWPYALSVNILLWGCEVTVGMVLQLVPSGHWVVLLIRGTGIHTVHLHVLLHARACKHLTWYLLPLVC